jgi:type II secretory pathway component HofQ
VADSILNTVKKSLGIEADYTAFDVDILMFTNAVLSNLNQIGVGPVNGFQIEDASATWDDLLGDDPRLNNVKAFVYLKVRMLFDPPATSFAIQAMETNAKEFEYRIYTTVEVDKWQ